MSAKTPETVGEIIHEYSVGRLAHGKAIEAINTIRCADMEYVIGENATGEPKKCDFPNCNHVHDNLSRGDMIKNDLRNEQRQRMKERLGND